MGKLLLEGRNAHGEPGGGRIGFGIRESEATSDCSEIGVGLRGCDVGLEPRKHSENAGVAVGDHPRAGAEGA